MESDYVRIPALSFTSWVTLGKLTSLYFPSRHDLKKGDTNSSYILLLGGLNEYIHVKYLNQYSIHSKNSNMVNIVQNLLAYSDTS